jgi:hypothetical protein
MESPELTVVVPSVNGLGDLVGCLEAADRLRQSVRVELLVVDRLGGAVAETVKRRFPQVTLLSVPAATTIPQMRDLAFRQARGDAVAVIEDHIIVPPDWGTRLLGALREGSDVVGGPIENAARDRLLDWATFLCEYSACLPPLPAGPAEWLPGNNVVYRRALLEKYRAVTAEGGWENRLHDAMKADGVPLLCRPDIVVGHKKHFGFGEYLSQRYLYARSYAGARVAREGGAKRAGYGLAAFLLPPLLLYRTLQRLIAKRVAPGLVLRTLPLIGVFLLAWGWGEVVGYWFGAGGSLAKVR